MFTKKGYIMFEVVSALQKDIRRGNEQDAMFWALELANGYEQYLWRRLIVIANEDIGLAQPDIMPFVVAQRNAWVILREAGGQDETRLILANTILALCRAPKCRLADHFQCVVTSGWQQNKLDIPDYALDKHTLRGKQMGRNMEYFLRTEDDPINGMNGHIDDPYIETAQQLWAIDLPKHLEIPLPKSISKK